MREYEREVCEGREKHDQRGKGSLIFSYNFEAGCGAAISYNFEAVCGAASCVRGRLL